MSSLAIRASPRQAVVMRIVAGAVRNAAHAHPKWNIHPKAANSIAKRATGTLTANWPDVLAAPRALSEGSGGSVASRASVSFGHEPPIDKGGRHVSQRRPPLRRIHTAIGAMAAEARRAMQVERERALVDVLRLIAKEMA